MSVGYTLIGADGAPYRSAEPGRLGGHRRNGGYGRLDCPTALRWIARGHYVRQRVFFADEPTAIAAGYRPCASCLPERYAAWRSGGEWPDAGGAATWRTLRVSGPFDSAQLWDYLAARAIPAVERVVGGIYRRALRLPHGPAVVELDLSRSGRVRFRLPAGDSRDRAAAIRVCRRLLGIDEDPAEARAALAGDAVIGPLVAARPGLRVPGAVDGGELLVRAVVSQQISLAAARTVLGRIAADFGHPLKHGNERLFPSPERLAQVDPAALPMPAARGRAVVSACAAIASGELDLRAGADIAETRNRLLALPGIGEWTASYIALRVLRDPDAFLPTDLGIRRALERLGQEPGVAERWRPWRAYAAQHLWASAVYGTRRG